MSKSTSTPTVMGSPKASYAHYSKVEAPVTKRPHVAKTPAFDSVVNGTNAVRPATDYSKK